MRTTMENEKNELQDKTEQILSEVETLAKAEYEVARLKVIDNSSRLVGSLLLFQLGQRGGWLRLAGGFLLQCRHGRFGGLQIVLMLVQRFPF